MSILLLIATKFFSPTEELETMIEVDLPLYFFALLFSITVLIGLLAAPYQIYAEELEKRLTNEMKFRSKFQVFIDSDGRFEVKVGGTTETFGGVRNTTIMGWDQNYVAIACRNDSQARSEECIATIISACKVSDGVEIPLEIYEPIKLPWDYSNPEDNLSKTLEPMETARIWLARAANGGQVWLCRDIKSLPIDYQQFLGEEGTYRFVVQVSDGSSEPVLTKFEITGEKVEGSKASSSFGEIKLSIIDRIALSPQH